MLSTAEQNYTITEKECLSVVWAVNKFRPYLYGRHFTIVTDHHALGWLSSLKDLTGRLGRWTLALQGYNYTVVYKSGRKHTDADGLPRCPLDEPDERLKNMDDVFDVSAVNYEHITLEQSKDPWIKEIIEHLNKPTHFLNKKLRKQLQHFSLQDGVPYRHNFSPEGNRWLVIVPRQICKDILQSFHDDPTSGHMGFQKTYARIRRRYFWPHLQTSVLFSPA